MTAPGGLKNVAAGCRACYPAGMAAKLSIPMKIIYGSGDTGFSLTSTLMAAYFAVFLTDVVGLAPAAAAAAIFIGRSWDYVNDPLIGYLSDRTRTRWGRRRPFLLFGAVPFALAFTLMWWRPPFTSPVWLAVWYGAAYFLYDTAATFVYMPYFALTPELTSDYDERTSLTSFRMFFSIVGSLAAFTVPLAIVGSFKPENAGKVFLNGAIFAAASAVPLLLVFFTAREDKEHAAAEKPHLLKSLKSAVKNKPFRFGLGIYLFTWLSMDIVQTILLYYLTWIVRRQADSDLIMAVIFVTAIVSLPFWNYLSRRLSKRAAYIGGVAFWAVVQLVLITLGPDASLGLIIALCVLAGIGVGSAHVLPWSILPDAVEWDEWKTGERHEGTFYSLVTLGQKVASSIAIPLALVLLGALGYSGTSATQPASALMAIRLVMGPIPAVLLGLGIVCGALYPITRAMHAQILKELAERKAAGRTT
jgi:glycoside/pentoside/hexuronide:cation symporter, GPH family